MTLSFKRTREQSSRSWEIYGVYQERGNRKNIKKRDNALTRGGAYLILWSWVFALIRERALI